MNTDSQPLQTLNADSQLLQTMNTVSEPLQTVNHTFATYTQYNQPTSTGKDIIKQGSTSHSTSNLAIHARNDSFQL